MRLQNRSPNEHGTLVLLELAVVPVAILATFLMLALAELGFAALRIVIGAMGAGETIVSVANAVIAAGTVLVLVGGAGSLVVGYRHYFRSQFDRVSPLAVILVPLVGVLAPVGYVLWTTGSLRLSWLFFPVAIAAYALAYRTIAIDSLREERGQPGAIIGSLTGLPVVALLIDLGIRLLDPELPIARTLETIVTGTSVLTARSVVIAVPLLVTVLYGVVTLSSVQSRRAGAETEAGTGAGTTAERSRSLSRLRTVIAARTTRSWTDSFGRKLGGTDVVRLVSESVRSSDGSASPPSQQRSNTANAVVPSSPGSSPTERGAARSGGGDDSGSADERPAKPPAGSDDGPRSTGTAGDERDGITSESRDNSGTTSTGSDSITDRTAGSNDGDTSSETETETETETESVDDASLSMADDSADETSTMDNSADETSSPDDSADDSSSEKVASDTRIFVDDFEQYGPDESSGETPVETCPDCEQEIPSDGVYNFCPFCGAEL